MKRKKRIIGARNKGRTTRTRRERFRKEEEEEKREERDNIGRLV